MMLTLLLIRQQIGLKYEFTKTMGLVKIQFFDRTPVTPMGMGCFVTALI
jgi:hypothetical protein